VTDQTTSGEYVIPSHVLHREVDGQMVLLDLVTETYFGLDGVGADMVRRLLEAPFDAALGALIDEYDADPATIRADVERLIDELVNSGLISRAQR
jgi:hypothetical protein